MSLGQLKIVVLTLPTIVVLGILWYRHHQKKRRPRVDPGGLKDSLLVSVQENPVVNKSETFGLNSVSLQAAPTLFCEEKISGTELNHINIDQPSFEEDKSDYMLESADTVSTGEHKEVEEIVITPQSVSDNGDMCDKATLDSTVEDIEPLSDLEEGEIRSPVIRPKEKFVSKEDRVKVDSDLEEGEIRSLNGSMDELTENFSSLGIEQININTDVKLSLPSLELEDVKPVNDRDSANQSPSEVMLASPSISNFSDARSVGSESGDSGKGRSDSSSPAGSPAGGSVAGDPEESLTGYPEQAVASYPVGTVANYPERAVACYPEEAVAGYPEGAVADYPEGAVVHYPEEYHPNFADDSAVSQYQEQLTRFPGATGDIRAVAQPPHENVSLGTIPEENLVAVSERSLSPGPREPSTPPHICFQFEFPQRVVGRLIGKRGSFLSVIRNETNTDVLIKLHPDTDKLKLVAIEGTPSNVEKALGIIREKFPLRQFPDISLDDVPYIVPPYKFEDLLLPFVSDVNNEVVISSLVSPSHVFFLQPHHPTYSKLIGLSAAMTKHYNDVDKGGVPPPPLAEVQLNTVCAAPGLEGWYRAVIVLIDEGTELCYVRYLDFGGYAAHHPRDLRQIHGDFLDLPFQAVECYLANVEPADGAWTEDARDLVQYLTFGKVVRASIYTYNEVGIPLVYLYTSFRDEVVLVNQMLVDQGHARLVESRRPSNSRNSVVVSTLNVNAREWQEGAVGGCSS